MKDKNGNKIEIGMNVRCRDYIEQVLPNNSTHPYIKKQVIVRGYIYSTIYWNVKFCEIIDLSGDWE